MEIIARRTSSEATAGGEAIDSRHRTGSTDSRLAKYSRDREDSPNASNNPEEQFGAEEYLRSWRLGVTISCLFVGTMLTAIDVNMLAVAIPKLAADLNALSQVAWIGSTYLLTLTAFQPILGKCYKFFNMRTVLLTSITTFEVGSILCAAAPNYAAFCLGRAVSGIGAAGIFQGSFSIIARTVDPAQRPKYNGIVTSAFGVSICFGPVVGGLFTDKATWRWCFWINLPFGAVVVTALLLLLPRNLGHNEDVTLSPLQKFQHMDPLGTVMFVGSIACFLFAFQWGGHEEPWNSPRIIGLLVGGICLFLLFGLLQWKLGEKASVPLRFFKKRTVATSLGTLFCLGGANSVISFYLPFYFQAAQGANAVTSGVQSIALYLPQMFSVAVTGVIVTKVGFYVPFMLLGESISAIGTAFLTNLEANSTAARWAPPLVFAAVGMGMAQNLPYTALQLVLSKSDIPTGNALGVFSWLISGALTITISQNIALAVIRDTLPSLTSEITPDKALAIGSYNLGGLGLKPQVVEALHIVWNKAVTRIFILPLALICIAVPITFGMEWLNVKKKVDRDEKPVENPPVEEEG